MFMTKANEYKHNLFMYKMLSPLFHYDGVSMASVYFPRSKVCDTTDAVMIEEADALIELLPSGEVVYLELFNPPDLPEYTPLPFIYDHRHDTYDMFFMAACPASFSMRSTDQEDVDLLFDNKDITKVVGLRICNARTRLPHMDL